MIDPATLLTILRSGQPLAATLAAHGLTAEASQAALTAYLRSKVPPLAGKIRSGVEGPAKILRDRHGVPHIHADDPHDLFFAYGYATAQDRLWQLDYLRRAAQGRLAEVLGSESIPSDVEVRTIGIGRLARELVPRLPGATLELLAAFASGINALMDDCRDNLPIEFEVLYYTCEPWTVADSLALMKHFWWQLTGRLYQICGPELMQRALGDGPLYQAFLRSEVHGESIIPPGENRARPLPVAPGPAGRIAGEVAGPGSNNWVISPGKSASGQALLASDPHTPYLAPTIWYEVHLHGPGYNVAGMSYVGIPGVVFGRNEKGAWGITNNICSLRDLYVLPKKDPGWRGKHNERISVRGSSEYILPLTKTEHGPIVNHLLTASTMDGPSVALRWVGTEISDEIGCLLRLNRAGSVDEFRQALSSWTCPTFNFVWADAAGNIAYQTAGRLPRRPVPGRGLRQAANPSDQWAGFFPFESNPWCQNPKQGWLGTANNPVLPAKEDPGLGGMWTSDARARRIRRRLTGQDKISLKEAADFQLDTMSERARDMKAALTDALAGAADAKLQAAAQLLRDWDGDMRADSTAAALFDAFSRHWGALVLAVRVSKETSDLVLRHVFGLMFELLKTDDAGWFASAADRSAGIHEAMRRALEEVEHTLGPDLSLWRWGDLHPLTLRHPLGNREPLGPLFNTGPRPIGGSSHTINNQTLAATGSYEANAGPCCRIAADLGTMELLVTSCLGQSGHPGSPHYRDQTDDWFAGRQHLLSLDWQRLAAEAVHVLELQPSGG